MSIATWARNYSTVLGAWILTTGFWVDSGSWLDGSAWID